MLRLSCDDYEIVINNDPSYTPGSADNLRSYSVEYDLADHPHLWSSRHSVKITFNGSVVRSCIILADGGSTGVHEHSALIYQDACILAVGPYLCSLKIPELLMAWRAQVDWGTCFGVYHAARQRCFITHGELEIARVSYDGEVAWRTSGKDIFSNGFSLGDEYAEAVDWNNERYRINLATGDSVLVED